MRFTAAILFVLAGLVSAPRVWHAALAGDAAKPDSTRKLEIDVDTFGDGDNRDTRYAVPTANGPVTVGEYAHARAIRADDGTAGFRTAANGHDGRSVYFSIRGTKLNSEYVDIDGDGMLDARTVEPTGKLFIAVEGRWVEVGDQKVGFSIGNSRTTVADPPASYVFKESAWVKE
jgi:hypothetical protein